MRTFLLLQADPGHAVTIARQVATLPGVTSAVVTSGPYDVVVEVDASAEAQRRELCARVKQADGLARLCVCRPTE